jgi:molybdate transport system substrate-binding protein
MRKIFLASFVAIIPALFAVSSAAQGLKVFGGGHFEGSGKSAVEAFVKKTGIEASYTPGNTGGPALQRRLGAGEQMDVIVMTRDDMDDQVNAGLIRPDSVVSFAQDGMGVAVLKGAPKPDVSTRDKFRTLLLAARAVGLQDPDPAHHSGIIVHKMLVDLGVLDEVMKKAVIIKNPAADLIAGKVDFSIWSLPELMTQNKLDVAGPVPSDLGGYTLEAVGILMSAKDIKDAQAFIDFISGPDGRAAWMKTGLLPLSRTGN